MPHPPLIATSEPPINTSPYFLWRPSPGGSEIGDFRKNLESGVKKLTFYFGDANSNYRNSLRKQGYPSLNASIARVSSPLKKGDSGAPICNTNGEVIAIADGGLYDGLREYNWGIIAAQYLNELDGSYELFSNIPKTDPSLYLVTDNVDNSPPLIKNGLHIEKVFTTTLGEINATLNMSSTEKALVDQDYKEILDETGKYVSSAKIDVYKELNSGATFAIPRGFNLDFADSDGEFTEIQALAPDNKSGILFFIANDVLEDHSQAKTFLEMFVEEEMDFEEFLEDKEARIVENDPEYEYYLEERFFDGPDDSEFMITLIANHGDLMIAAAAIGEVYDDEEPEMSEYYYFLIGECTLLSNFPEY